jgi:acetyltransferase-like isoleucine patch superfamily enzyme
VITGVGKYTYGQGNVVLHYPKEANLKIGSFCSIADNCHIYLAGSHRIDRLTTYPFGHIHQKVFNKFDGTGHPKPGRDVVIGNDVWIACNVTIMSGVTVGDGAVIALNSHVVKNVEPYSLVGGNPARLIRYRFEKKIIDKLLAIKWWTMPDDKINQLLPFLCSGDFDLLFKEVEEIDESG